MNRKLALAVFAAALLAACAQSPTAPSASRTSPPRFDDAGSTTGTATATPGGNAMGSGH